MSSPDKNAIFVATVRDLTSDGRGVLSHPNGLTVFVPGVWPGEECRVRFTGLQNRIGLAEPVEIVQPTRARVAPRCPHHGFSSGQCGGCPWQFIDYDEQLRVKEARLKQAFARLDFHRVQPIWPSEDHFAYRNRAQLKTDGEVLGYLSTQSNILAPIRECPILSAPNQNTLRQLLQLLPNKAWRIDPRQRRRLQWTSLNIDDSLSADQVMVNQRLPFQQHNHRQNEKMRTWLGRHLQRLARPFSVLELFCGSGNFTEVIATSGADKILAVEGDRRALAALDAKALPAVVSLAADLFDPHCFSLIYQQQRAFNTLVLDPPRDGMKTIDSLLPKSSSITNIFYISCNLATLCRDLAQLRLRGFTISEVQALDQTPHTPHIEVLVALSR